MIMMDKYAYINRWAEKNPLEKVSFAILTMLTGLIAGSPLISLLIILVMLMMVIKAGIPFRYYLTLMLGPLFFILLGILTIFMNWQWGATGIFGGTNFFHISFVFSSDILQKAVNLLLKALSAVSCLYFLCLTTPVVEIIGVLRKLKFPALFLELMTLVYRFIFVLMETAERMVISQSSRLGYTDLPNGYRSARGLTATLFVRSYKRAGDLYTALEARCYDGEINGLDREYPLSKKNSVLIIIFNGALIMLAILLRIATGGFL